MNLPHKKFKENLKKRQVTEILTLLLSKETCNLCRKVLWEYIDKREIILSSDTQGYLIYSNDKVVISFAPRSEVFIYKRLLETTWLHHSIKLNKINVDYSVVVKKLIKAVNEDHEY